MKILIPGSLAHSPRRKFRDGREKIVSFILPLLTNFSSKKRGNKRWMSQRKRQCKNSWREKKEVAKREEKAGNSKRTREFELSFAVRRNGTLYKIPGVSMRKKATRSGNKEANFFSPNHWMHPRTSFQKGRQEDASNVVVWSVFRLLSGVWKRELVSSKWMAQWLKEEALFSWISWRYDMTIPQRGR